MEFQFNPTVDSIEVVPADFRGLYAKTDDGKFALRSDDEGVKSAVSAITGLSRALKASRAEAAGLKGKAVDLSALGEYGSTPEEILQSIETKLQEAGKGKGEPKDWDARLKAAQDAVREQASKQAEAAQKRIDALTGQLHSILVTGEARSALAEAGAIDAELALPFLAQQVVVSEENGQFTVSVVGPDKSPRYSGVTGQPMSVKELVAEMKGQEKYGPLFKSDRPSGGGTPANQPRQAPGSQKREEMSSSDKIKQGLAARQQRR